MSTVLVAIQRMGFSKHGYCLFGIRYRFKKLRLQPRVFHESCVLTSANQKNLKLIAIKTHELFMKLMLRFVS